MLAAYSRLCTFYDILLLYPGGMATDDGPPIAVEQLLDVTAGVMIANVGEE